MVSFINRVAGAAMEADLWGTGSQTVLAERTRRTGWANAAERANVIDTVASIEAGVRVPEALVDIVLAGVPFEAWPALANDDRVGDDASPAVGAGIRRAEVHQLAVLPWKQSQTRKPSLFPSFFLLSGSHKNVRLKVNAIQHPVSDSSHPDGFQRKHSVGSAAAEIILCTAKGLTLFFVTFNRLRAEGTKEVATPKLLPRF